jgi:L-alanine-DL-glutamate epimerase-like enolase superfamily enzyme
MELAPNLDDARGMAANAARCALELAVLDAYGHRFGQSISAAIRAVEIDGLQLSARPTRVRYSGAITAASPGREVYSAVRMWLYGFRHIKLKVGVEGQDDVRRLRTLRGVFGRPMDFRLDANEAWASGTVVERVRELLPYRPSAIEQPVPHAEVGSLAEIRPRLGLPVMLDESLCGYPDAVRSVEDRTADLFNVRLSKCGGLIPTLRIIGLAQRSGLGLQLGCHPGETGLLSAAGRHLAGNVRGLRYVEGSYDRHILTHNLTVEDLTFGYGGLAPPLAGSGLGVRVEPSRLEALVVRSEEIRYD